MEQRTTNRGLGSTITATLDALPLTPGASVRFPGEDGGSSLAEMAQRDLDAALQLLADRAQYITGANGAAIALRRRGKNDMQCRASAGENVPELGALLSTEFGLSGESVRTRQALRCDDAERDPRVNREGCRQLGIASVVVMPVVNDDEVLGVFELFSGKVNAFGDRDLSALQRLSEMVETAVKLARAAEIIPGHAEVSEVPVAAVNKAAADSRSSGGIVPLADATPATEAKTSRDSNAAPEALRQPKADLPVAREPVVQAVPAKPLFWSAAMNSATGEKVAQPDQSHVPPGLRNLRSCEACGFPVSLGRALCVECEEKRWRGQLKRPSVLGAKVGQVSPNRVPPLFDLQSSGQTKGAQALPTNLVKAGSLPADTKNTGPAGAATGSGPVARLIAAAQAAAAPAPTQPGTSPTDAGVPSAVLASKAEATRIPPPEAAGSGAAPLVAGSSEVDSEPKMQDVATPDFVLSAGLEPRRSWLTGLYLVAVLLLVAAAVAATIFLH